MGGAARGGVVQLKSLLQPVGFQRCLRSTSKPCCTTLMHTDCGASQGVGADGWRNPSNPLHSSPASPRTDGIKAFLASSETPPHKPAKWAPRTSFAYDSASDYSSNNAVRTTVNAAVLFSKRDSTIFARARTEAPKWRFLAECPPSALSFKLLHFSSDATYPGVGPALDMYLSLRVWGLALPW
ncbi:hypothetical protein HaLaN_11582, partial [Haematococcus lacustris]